MVACTYPPGSNERMLQGMKNLHEDERFNPLTYNARTAVAGQKVSEF